MEQSEQTTGSAEKEMVRMLFQELRKERKVRYMRLVTTIIISLVSFYLIFGNTRNSDMSGLKFRKKTYYTENPENKKSGSVSIAVKPVEGTLYGNAIIEHVGSGFPFQSTKNMVWEIREFLSEIKKDKNIKLLVLFIDSPGGTTFASEEIYSMLLGWKKETGIRVLAYINTVGASGGYYVAQAADEIVANEQAITGSIGVILSTWDYSDLASRIGIKFNVVTTGPFKDIGSPHRVMREDEKMILQNLLDQSFQRFLAVIATGRKGKITSEKIRALADGRIYTGAEAFGNGLIDRTSSFDAMIKEEIHRIKENGYEGGVKVDIYGRETSTFSASFSSFFSSPTTNRIATPQLMYLWPGLRS